MRINWDSFISYSQDSRGVHYKFEDLCRQLFVNENLFGNKQFRYLHANPNNYGLETEPIYDEVNQRWIGFQVKYFKGDADYEQIKHSAEKTVEYYTGKAGYVDLVFLFCNKPITVTAKGYVDTVKLLKAANIDIQLITDNQILDLVRKKYPYLGLYYFGNHILQNDWFVVQAKRMFEELGERYNREFNVETDSLDELSLFVHDRRAAEYINSKKTKLLSRIDQLYWKRDDHRSYLHALRNAVSDLLDVDTESLYHAAEWVEKIKTIIKADTDLLTQKINDLEIKRTLEYSVAFGDEQEEKEKKEALRKYHDLGRQVSELTNLLELPEMIAITDREDKLLHGQIMTLYGNAGTGKSQLLAMKTQSLLDEGRAALLLVAGIYFTADPIQEQITKYLRLDFSFEELIDILETIGEKNNCIVPIFIDAINETWINRIWKTGLSSMGEKIRQSTMVRAVVSYRPEYEKQVLPDSMRNRNDDVVTIHHRGFEDNSIIAVREFLDHYNIPFTPLEYFGYEMSNPLFLTLFCKTYNGQEVTMPTLYERLIECAAANVYRAHEKELNEKGYDEEGNFLQPLINQIAKYMITHDERFISKDDIMQLRYWTDYGLTPAPYVRSLIRESILHESVFEGTEKLWFAYDQMNDYYCAKAIFELCKSKDEIRCYLIEKVLRIENSILQNGGNIDLFVNACVLYEKKYGEECIDIIDGLKEDDDKREVFSRYVRAFQWRDTKCINADGFIDLLKKYPCVPDDLWTMLISNSVKASHPFNADFLHNLLLRYELNKRDYLWTIYINRLTWNESDRIVQLVKLYNSGEKLEISNVKQVELFLTLLGWLLTSSNRWLRDYTSKAMTEILKKHFGLCKKILEKFETVNDPYVIQRLYGVVFGACCKRTNGDLQELSEYVYETIFNQEKVYPDILLRDYARLIIERFLYETPSYNGVIHREIIIPPYNSDPIPEIEYQHYEDKDYEGALLRLTMSMRIEKMGGYGDFGRYIFQNALSSFEVDEKKMFNYAVYHILNEMGFKEEYFDDHDRDCRSFDRHLTAKIERIGKKYQWITLYNMLARISDNCKMVDRWSYPEKEDIYFEGAWELFIRDFDPTLDSYIITCSDAPVFSALDEHRTKGIEENKSSDILTLEKKNNWLEHKGVFFRTLKDTLILTDGNGQQWVALTKYRDTGRENLDIEKLSVWSWLYAYFMSPEQAGIFLKQAEKGHPIITSDVASHQQSYTIFNREYPWSPSCKSFVDDGWVDVSIRTGEFETIIETVQIPELSWIEDLLCGKYGITNDDVPGGEVSVDENEAEMNDSPDESDIPSIQFKKETRQREVEKRKEIGQILHATSDLVWEGEYDATKKEAISRSFPCAKLIEEMGLRQLVIDGFLYDADRRLAAFDTVLTQKVNSVVVRKDILDSFLARTGLKLVWLVDAEKEIHARDYSIESWSDWEAVYTYEGDHIYGEIRRLPEGNRW